MTEKYGIRCIIISIIHCVERVQIWSYFWFVFSCIQTEYGDLLGKSEITPYLDIFHAVISNTNVTILKKGSQI